MTKVEFRRRVVRVVELTIKYTTAAIIMSCGCIAVAVAVGACLRGLGVG
jgi:hypothetical protein